MRIVSPSGAEGPDGIADRLFLYVVIWCRAADSARLTQGGLLKSSEHLLEAFGALVFVVYRALIRITPRPLASGAS